jgi:hypothetical protein
LVLFWAFKCFIHLIFGFWFLVTFGEELMKYFARQDRRDGKKGVKNHAAKVTKVPKRRKYGMNESEFLFKIK